MKKRIITIAGYPGSGKSSAAKGVALALGYRHFSSGDLFRKMAAERGLSVEEMNITAEKQQEVDRAVDKLLVEQGERENDLVIDSRMAFHWIPDSFKVFLDLDPKIAAERTFAHIQSGERKSQAAASADEVYAKTEERVESERKRYMALYAVDPADKKQFDLIVNTAMNDSEGVVKIIRTAYEEWLHAAN